MSIAETKDAIGILKTEIEARQTELAGLIKDHRKLSDPQHKARIEEVSDYLGLLEEALAGREQELADHGKPKKLSRAEKSIIWHKLSHYSRQFFPYYPDFKLTPAEFIILRGLVEQSGGRHTVAVAHGYISKKYHVSRSQVKATMHKLKALGLISVRERRRTGQKMNLTNLYTITCRKLLEWARKCFFKRGSENQPHNLTVSSSVATAVENAVTSNQVEREVKPCRQKARRFLKAEASPDLNSEDYALLATGALDYLGSPLPDEPTPDEIDLVVDALMEEKQPDFKPYFRIMGEYRHGPRRTRLAFLETQMIKAIRLTPIPDKRPWNERETIKDPNRYMAKILMKERGKARPEVTIGAILKDRQIYELPYRLLREIRQRALAKSSA